MGLCYSSTKSITKQNPFLHPINETIEWKHTIPFMPPIDEGIVIKVYDGDTITIASRLPYKESPLYRFQIRLNGIDSPEIKGKTDEEKAAAQKSRQELESLILNKTVILKNKSQEKYGRILADVYLVINVGEHLNVNSWLLDHGYAVPYNGGKKQEFHLPNT